MKIGSVVPGATEPKAASLTIHCDVDFTSHERDWFTTAASIWAFQTNGLADIRVVFDLNFQDTYNLAYHRDQKHNLILRGDSSLELVQEEDRDCGRPGCTLAFVTSGGIHNPWGKPINGVFIPERYPSDEYAIMVVLHEMGHMFGLPHLPSVQSLMFPSIISNRSACLKKADLSAFCDVNECGSTKMRPCE